MNNNPETFEAEFHARFDDITRRAKAVGLTITALCQKTGIARATPDRWRKKAPLSITLVDRFEAEVAAAEKVAAEKVNS